MVVLRVGLLGSLALEEYFFSFFFSKAFFFFECRVHNKLKEATEISHILLAPTHILLPPLLSPPEW